MKTGTFEVVRGSPVTPSTIPSSEAWLFSFLSFSFLNFEAFGLISWLKVWTSFALVYGYG